MILLSLSGAPLRAWFALPHLDAECAASLDGVTRRIFPV
jgi:hypothetical protein